MYLYNNTERYLQNNNLTYSKLPSGRSEPHMHIKEFNNNILF